MTDVQLRTRIGLFWIFAHFAIISMVIACFFLHGFEFDEMTTLLAVIVPMFAGTTTVILRYFTAHAQDAMSGAQVNAPYIIVTVTLPLLFSITILATVILRARNLAFDTFDECKLFLTATEAVYVVYTSIVLAPLFKAKPEDLSRHSESSASRSKMTEP
jgi:lysylphosphatidylglycerol synthetase-like protein (DUF2156 family)